MHNWYAMEVEAESRRQEYEQARVAADRVAEAASSDNGRGRFSAFRFFRPRVLTVERTLARCPRGFRGSPATGRVLSRYVSPAWQASCRPG